MGNKQSGHSGSSSSSGQRRGQHSQRPAYSHQHQAQQSRPTFQFPKMGNANTVKKHVETAEKTGACQLAKLGLDEVPEDLNRLINNLRNLDLSENRIPVLPPNFGQYKMLKSLNLSSNRLSALPEQIGELKKLETLNVSTNQLTTFPASLSSLKSLKTVIASHNRFVAMPVIVYTLRNLDVIDLSNCKITSVPDGINEIQAIEINLNQNQISVLSEDVADCPRLKVLRLEENCIEKGMITPKILKHSQIALLAIDGNLFPAKDFPHMDGYEEYQERYTATKKKMG